MRKLGTEAYGPLSFPSDHREGEPNLLISWETLAILTVAHIILSKNLQVPLDSHKRIQMGACLGCCRYLASRLQLLSSQATSSAVCLLPTGVAPNCAAGLVLFLHPSRLFSNSMSRKVVHFPAFTCVVSPQPAKPCCAATAVLADIPAPTPLGESPRLSVGSCN